METQKQNIMDLQVDMLNLIKANSLEDRNFAFTYVNGTVMFINLETPDFKEKLDEAKNKAEETEQ